MTRHSSARSSKRRSRWRPAVALVMAFSLTSPAAAAVITDATMLWTPVPYAGPNQYDYEDDQQTGTSQSSADIVGNTTNSALYTNFDNGGTSDLSDGTLFFRARLGAPGGSGTPVFDRNLFIGIDANSDGALDLYLGVHNQGSADELAIYGPGNDLNISPNTTSITGPLTGYTYAETASNYLYTPVDTTDLDIDLDGNTDYFLSFAFDFNEIVTLLSDPLYGGFLIDETTPLSYVMATATQDNSFNQDINGVPKTFDGSLTWEQLGAMSAPIAANGETSAVPEPHSLVLMAVAFVLAGVWTRRLRNRSRTVDEHAPETR